MANDVTFTDNSDAVLSALEKATKKALEAIGATAEGHAKRGTPVDTGRLRNSIGHQVDGNEVYIGTNVEYAPYIEYGTSKGVKPHHMLEKAATEHADEYRNIAEAAFKSEGL